MRLIGIAKSIQVYFIISYFDMSSYEGYLDLPLILDRYGNVNLLRWNVSTLGSMLNSV